MSASREKQVKTTVAIALAQLDGIVEIVTARDRLWFQVLRATTSVLGEIAISLARLEQKRARAGKPTEGTS